MNHTPGPWATYGHRQRFVQTEDATIEIAEINRNEDNAEANARLVVAAPDMLAALVMLVAGDEAQCLDDEMFDAARAAIAKAVGDA